jgi:hypothetical protein
MRAEAPWKSGLGAIEVDGSLHLDKVINDKLLITTTVELLHRLCNIDSQLGLWTVIRAIGTVAELIDRLGHFSPVDWRRMYRTRTGPRTSPTR